MDAPCSIQGNIHVFSLIKKCVQDSGYISICEAFFVVHIRSGNTMKVMIEDSLKRITKMNLILLEILLAKN